MRGSERINIKPFIVNLSTNEITQDDLSKAFIGALNELRNLSEEDRKLVTLLPIEFEYGTKKLQAFVASAPETDIAGFSHDVKHALSEVELLNDSLAIDNLKRTNGARIFTTEEVVNGEQNGIKIREDILKDKFVSFKDYKSNVDRTKIIQTINMLEGRETSKPQDIKEITIPISEKELTINDLRSALKFAHVQMNKAGESVSEIKVVFTNKNGKFNSNIISNTAASLNNHFMNISYEEIDQMSKEDIQRLFRFNIKQDIIKEQEIGGIKISPDIVKNFSDTSAIDINLQNNQLKLSDIILAMRLSKSDVGDKFNIKFYDSNNRSSFTIQVKCKKEMLEEVKKTTGEVSEDLKSKLSSEVKFEVLEVIPQGVKIDEGLLSLFPDLSKQIGSLSKQEARKPTNIKIEPSIASNKPKIQDELKTQATGIITNNSAKQGAILTQNEIGITSMANGEISSTPSSALNDGSLTQQKQVSRSSIATGNQEAPDTVIVDLKNTFIQEQDIRDALRDAAENNKTKITFNVFNKSASFTVEIQAAPNRGEIKGLLENIKNDPAVFFTGNGGEFLNNFKFKQLNERPSTISIDGVKDLFIEPEKEQKLSEVSTVQPTDRARESMSNSSEPVADAAKKTAEQQNPQPLDQEKFFAYKPSLLERFRSSIANNPLRTAAIIGGGLLVGAAIVGTLAATIASGGLFLPAAVLVAGALGLTGAAVGVGIYGVTKYVQNKNNAKKDFSDTQSMSPTHTVSEEEKIAQGHTMTTSNKDKVDGIDITKASEPTPTLEQKTNNESHAQRPSSAEVAAAVEGLLQSGDEGKIGGMQGRYTETRGNYNPSPAQEGKSKDSVSDKGYDEEEGWILPETDVKKLVEESEKERLATQKSFVEKVGHQPANPAQNIINEEREKSIRSEIIDQGPAKNHEQAATQTKGQGSNTLGGHN